MVKKMIRPLVNIGKVFIYYPSKCVFSESGHTNEYALCRPTFAFLKNNYRVTKYVPM